MIRPCSLSIQGRCQDNGQRSGTNTAVHQEVHADEGEHPGGCAQDTDAEVKRRHGAGDEGRHEGDGDDEQAGQLELCSMMMKR